MRVVVADACCGLIVTKKEVNKPPIEINTEIFLNLIISDRLLQTFMKSM
jgi:hypothetical protein